MKDRFLLDPEVEQMTGLSKVTRWRGEKDGTFPKRRQISPGRVAWLESEVVEWMKSRPFSEIKSPKGAES